MSWCAFRREAWLSVVLQVVKLFALSRVSMKQLSTLPGMPPLPDVEVPVAPAATTSGRPEKGKGVRAALSLVHRAAGCGFIVWDFALALFVCVCVCVWQKSDVPQLTEQEQAAIAKARAKQLAPDSMLTSSNFMNVSECLLLRWLSYHHNTVAPESPRRVVDLDRDLRDGVVLARVVLSHCPQLKEPGRELADMRWTPATEDDYFRNVQVRALVTIVCRRCLRGLFVVAVISAATCCCCCCRWFCFRLSA